MSPQTTKKRIDYSRRFLLFIPLETQRSRRALVIGYYLFFIAFGAMLVWFRGPAKYDRLLPLSFYFATILGGFHFGAPVRVFSQWQRDIHGGGDTLGERTGLSWLAAGPSRPAALDRLDEHDIALRDRAHYLAYSALRWPAIAAALFGGIFLLDASSAQVGHWLVILSVPVATLFFSLPQAIILWTEPDPAPETSSAGTFAGAAQ